MDGMGNGKKWEWEKNGMEKAEEREEKTRNCLL